MTYYQRIKSFCFLGLLAGAHLSAACPVYMTDFALLANLNGPRSSLRLFTLSRSGAWRDLPVQIDPLDKEGHFRFFTGYDWLLAPISRNDRITFYSEEFGRRWARTTQFPCDSKNIWELSSSGDEFAYLTLCEDARESSILSPRVTYTPANNTLHSTGYTYIFSPGNQMLFQKIFVSSSSGKNILIAHDSDLDLFADLKNFFSLHFGSGDIESYLENYRIGPLGVVATVSFYLKVLFFKIKLQLLTDVSFFLDSAHVPMMVYLPYSGSDYLHNGSGIFYSWETEHKTVEGMPQKNVPIFSGDSIDKGIGHLASNGLSFCRGDECIFSLDIPVDGIKKTATMQFSIQKNLVSRGFFPQSLDDQTLLYSKLGWPSKFKSTGKNRTGLYFETSGLPQGESPWDFWINIAESSASVTCPGQVKYELVTGAMKFRQ